MWSISNGIRLNKTRKINLNSTITFDASYSTSNVTKYSVTGYNVYKIDASSSALTTPSVPSYTFSATVEAKSNFPIYYLCIGSGGAGSSINGVSGRFGGGGGAFLEGSFNLLQDTSATITFTAGGTLLDSIIVYSSNGMQTTVTGGRGGGEGTTPNYGGSGCGGSMPNNGTTSGQLGVPPGKNGGIGRYAVSNYYGGGGGGAGSNGDNYNAGSGRQVSTGTGINLVTGTTVFCTGGDGTGYYNGSSGGTTYGCGGKTNTAGAKCYRGVIYIAIPKSAIP